MKTYRRIVFAAAMAGASVLPLSSAQAWWGPWTGWGPWDGMGSGEFNLSIRTGGSARSAPYWGGPYYGHPGYWGVPYAGPYTNPYAGGHPAAAAPAEAPKGN